MVTRRKPKISSVVRKTLKTIKTAAKECCSDTCCPEHKSEGFQSGIRDILSTYTSRSFKTHKPFRP